MATSAGSLLPEHDIRKNALTISIIAKQKILFFIMIYPLVFLFFEAWEKITSHVKRIFVRYLTLFIQSDFLLTFQRHLLPLCLFINYFSQTSQLKKSKT